MPLQTQTAPVQMGFGVDTKTDPKQVQGKLITLENGRLETYQRVSKRNGYGLISSLSSNAQGLGALDNDLILFGNASVKTYSTAANLVDRFSPWAAAQLTSTKAVSTPTSHASSDMGVHSSGVRVIAWLNNRFQTPANLGIYYCVQDANSNTTLVSPTLISTVSAIPRVLVLGQYIVVIYNDSSTLNYVAIDTSNPTATPTPVTIFASASPPFDACVLSNTLYVAYQKDGTHISLKSLSSSLVLSAATDITVTLNSRNIAIYPDAATNRLWVSYSLSTSIKYFIVTTGFVSVLAETAVDTATAIIFDIAIYANNNSGIIVYDVEGSSTTDLNGIVTKKATANSAGTVSTAIFMRGSGINSNIFSVTVGSATMLCWIMGNATIGYATTGADGSTIPQASVGNYFLINDSGKILANFGAAGNGQGLSAPALDMCSAGRPAGVTLTSSTQFQIPYLLADDIGTRLGTTLTTARFGTNIALFDFASKRSYQTNSVANNLQIVAGLEEMYDGSVVVEHSFLYQPELVSFSAHASGGGTFAVGRYAYYAVYSWMDNKGNVHLSTPSNVDSVNVGSTSDYIDVGITTLRVTNKTGVTILLYRNNLDNANAYYLVGTAANDTTVDSVTIRDSSGTTPVDKVVIYTNGGVVDNFAVPAPRCQWLYKDRMMVVPEETPSIIWYSKLLQQSVPSNPVEFADVFQYQVNAYDGGIIGGTQMDEKCIVFKANTIWYFVGDGPADTGANNDFTPAQEIPTDAGLYDVRSIVTTPIGVLFKTRKGIYLLDRSLQVSYIGADVASYNSATILSAEMIQNTTLVRFILDSGIALNYDYIIHQWSVDTGFTNAVDAIVWNGSYTYINSSGSLLRETAGLFTDNGSTYNLKIVTNWLSFAKLQGYQRVWKFLALIDYISAHTMNIALAYDFESTPSQTLSFNAATTFVTPGSKNFRVFCSTGKCEAVQVTMYDSAGSGESFNLSGIAFEVGIEPKLDRLPASVSVG